MKRIRNALDLTLFMFVFTHTGLSLTQTEWVNLNGTVTFGDTPVVSMVLANGQYMFSNNPVGEYDLEVPLDENGQITLFCFVAGFAPYKEVLTPSGDVITQDIQMTRSDSTKLPQIGLFTNRAPMDEDDNPIPNRRLIEGVVSFNGEAVCSMVIANGQNTFTCDGTGIFELDCPLDQDGKITLYCFISGFSPFKFVFDPTIVSAPVNLNQALLLNMQLLGEWKFEAPAAGIDRTYLLDHISSAPIRYDQYGLSSIVQGSNDETDDTVYAYYLGLYDIFRLEDLRYASPGVPEEFFLFAFYFFDEDLVLGECAEIDPSTGDVMSDIYTFTGIRLSEL